MEAEIEAIDRIPLPRLGLNPKLGVSCIKYIYVFEQKVMLICGQEEGCSIFLMEEKEESSSEYLFFLNVKT